jgi:D-xylonolactonase
VALLGTSVAAVFGFMRRSLLRRIGTLELALAFAERRAARGMRTVTSESPAGLHDDRLGGGPEIVASVDCVWPARATLGEGGCWDPRARKVYWTDIKGMHLHAFSHDGTRQTWELPFRVGSVGIPPGGWVPPAELAGDVLIAAGDPGLMWLGLEDKSVCSVTIAHPEADLSENRFNDGKFGPDGRYWAGTMHDPETIVAGCLYAFSADGSHAVMDCGYHVPNGPAFSPDGRVLYHTDSALQTIYAFDLTPEGTLARKRVLVRFKPGEGSPDGMTVDGLGNLWVAMWDGSRIEKISPDGTRIGCIRLPTRRPTSCTFAGDDPKILYVTTAAIGLGPEDELAGGLFKIRLGP